MRAQRAAALCGPRALRKGVIPLAPRIQTLAIGLAQIVSHHERVDLSQGGFRRGSGGGRLKGAAAGSVRQRP